MKARNLAGAGFVSISLGALGCGEPARPEAVDAPRLFQNRADGGDAWRRYLEPQALHQAWAPPPGSPWRPYYKPTLIAAVAVVKDAAAPLRSAESDGVEGGVAALEGRVDLSKAAIFVDLPGEAAVAWGSSLLAKGFQPVPTFNNWPHQNGLLPLERALGALLLHASRAQAGKPGPSARPAFLLESGRLGTKQVSPNPYIFDNRYFHAATDFPDDNRLRAAGVERIVYVNPRGTGAGAETDDLNAYFVALGKSGLRFTYVCPERGDVANDVHPATRETIFTPAATANYAASGGHYYRPYAHYHHHYYTNYWTSSPGTWGSGSSGGGGSSRGWSS